MYSLEGEVFFQQNACELGVMRWTIKQSPAVQIHVDEIIFLQVQSGRYYKIEPKTRSVRDGIKASVNSKEDERFGSERTPDKTEKNIDRLLEQ